MKYVSTRGAAPALNFEEVLLAGLAGDGGLYMPETWPHISLDDLRGKSYADVAFTVMMPFIGEDIPASDLKQIITETYSDKIFAGGKVAPLRALSQNLYMLELFHGPTLAFKDIALQLLGRLFDYALKKRQENITIIGATSGDTGSAAIEGCRHCARAEIFILHPHDRVSEVQRRQMTTVEAPNVHNIAVEGSFDDCQALVKSLFNDADFRARHNLSAVNSINWARVMAQIVYYFYAAAHLPADKEIIFAVPTGNFGNVFAGFAAKKMGLCLRLAIATNRNDILARFFETGAMQKETLHPTISPSMDIQIASNFERYLFELLDRDAHAVKKHMEEFEKSGRFALDEKTMVRARNDFTAFRCGEEETLNTMREIFAEEDYVLDPHSAVGVHAASQLLNGPDRIVVALATAHPAKFPDAVEKATGLRPALPASLADLLSRPEKFTILPNDIKRIKEFIAP